jgi:hypothetical protein
VNIIQFWRRDGVPRPIGPARVPGAFLDYAGHGEPIPSCGWIRTLIVDEPKLLAELTALAPTFELAALPHRMILEITDGRRRAGLSTTTLFRPWFEFYECYGLLLYATEDDLNALAATVRTIRRT